VRSEELVKTNRDTVTSRLFWMRRTGTGEKLAKETRAEFISLAVFWYAFGWIDEIRSKQYALRSSSERLKGLSSSTWYVHICTKRNYKNVNHDCIQFLQNT
jgi:hypothetical protein